MGQSATEDSPLVLPPGTITFLLTDVEGSARWREQAPTAVARLRDILDDAIARHDGVRPIEQGEGCPPSTTDGGGHPPAPGYAIWQM
jgi:class 3 adenylate cyclase